MTASAPETASPAAATSPAHGTAPRYAWLALALSLLCMGVGHIYSGRITKGLLLYFAWLVVPVTGLILALLPPSAAGLVLLFLLPALGLILLYGYAAIDAAVSALTAGANYRLRDYNRKPVYLLLIVVGLSYPLGVLMGYRMLVYEAFFIPTSSMAPTVCRGDRVLANKIEPRSGMPKRGELIVFEHREQGRVYNYLKRVIAVSGDRIAIREGVVVLNGQPLPYEAAPKEAFPATADSPPGKWSVEVNSGTRYVIANDKPAAVRNTAPRNLGSQVIPEGHVFVMGDNRNRAKDSRTFGPVPVTAIRGRVDYLFYPAGSWQRFGVLGG